jgi:hypothetical protein
MWVSGSFIYLTGYVESYGFGLGDMSLYKTTFTFSPYTNLNNSLLWVVMDLDVNNGFYTIYRNGTVNATGIWVSNQLITFNLDWLPIGLWNITIVFKDGLGGIAQDTVWVWGTINQLPTITHVTIPPIIAGSLGTLINWTITDLNVNNPTYILYLNGTINVTSTWTSGILVFVSIMTLAPGQYNFTIVALDGYGGSATDTIIVTVLPNQNTTTTSTTTTTLNTNRSINASVIIIIVAVIGIGGVTFAIRFTRLHPSVRRAYKSDIVEKLRQKFTNFSPSDAYHLWRRHH